MSATENIATTRDYGQLLINIHSLIQGENNTMANLGNIIAAIKYSMDWFWVGLYKVEGDELVLYLFQGPHACTRIKKGKGVCGKSWEENKTIVVENVNDFEGHIACNALSKSEIVIPIRVNGEVKYVLDIDSVNYSDFNNHDAIELEKITSVIEQLI